MNHNGINILTGNGDVTHGECKSSPGMGMSLTGNGDVPHQEWGCASPGMHILTGNGDVPHRECTSSLGIHILTGNAHSLYRVRLMTFFFEEIVLAGLYFKIVMLG